MQCDRRYIKNVTIKVYGLVEIVGVSLSELHTSGTFIEFMQKKAMTNIEKFTCTLLIMQRIINVFYLSHKRALMSLITIVDNPYNVVDNNTISVVCLPAIHLFLPLQ